MDSILSILLNEALINRIFQWTAIVSPFLGLLVGLLWGVLIDRKKQLLIRGLAVGFLGPIILLMWQIYNSITNILGLDTVKNLLVNLLLFIVTGIILGGAYRFVFNKTETK